MADTRSLLKQEIWSPAKDMEREHQASPGTVALHYERARSVVRLFDFTLEDVLYLSPKFWQMHLDLLAARDMTAGTITTIHVNLCLGTICRFAKKQPDLLPLIDSLLKFDVCGGFMLTEVGHGLDARSLETTATLQPDGSFDLHTPNSAAAKAMPPTIAACGVPMIAVVFARLIVDGSSRGIKPFVVSIGNSGKLNAGISSRLLPVRPGTKPLDHAITTFSHVILPPGALLGSMSRPEDEKLDFFRQLWRVPIGGLALSMSVIPSIKVATHVAAIYSQRRTTSANASGGSPIPIISFSTQYRPIVDAWVYSAVLEPYVHWSIQHFISPDTIIFARPAFATLFKAVAIQSSRIMVELSERCGWQGLFTYNQIVQCYESYHGAAIAEGDILVLSLRVGAEILGELYELPEPLDPSCLLAQREKRMLREGKAKLEEIGGLAAQKTQEFNRLILPRCRPLIEAIGHRMAYDAARESGVCPKMLKIFEWLCLSTDPSDLAAAVDQDALAQLYEEILADILPQINNSETLKYITAPLLSEESWASFVNGLPLVQGGETIQPKL